MSKPKRSLEDGGSTNYINTIGLGYIFNKYGKKTIDFIRKRLYNNVLPWGYNDIPQRAYNAIVKNKKEVDETRDKALRDDLWATYLQIPKKERHNIKGGKVTLEKANYSPKGVNPNKEVYKFKDLLDVTKFGLLNYAGIIPYSVNFDSGKYLPIGKNRVVYPKDLGAFTELEGLGQFTVGRGYDKKGDYVSYYDSWDLGETNKNPYRDATFGIGKPFNVYDRIYLDDYFGVPNEHKGGIYLPEVLVTGTRKKHRNGGSNNISSYRRSIEDAGTVADYINAIYSNNPKEEFLGEPEHHYDFTQSEEWANAHGYYPDKRGHRDDRVKKPSHPSHPSRGTWEGNNFILTNKGLADPNYIFFGLNDGGQDPQAILKYKDTYVIPEITVTPKGSYINNSYDNIRIHFKEGGIHIAPSKRGTFTAAATKHGMGVQEFASRVLKNKDSYSPAMVKKANFARNASKWNH